MKSIGAFSRPGTTSLFPWASFVYQPESSHWRQRTSLVWKFWSTGTTIPCGYCGLISTVPDEMIRPALSSSRTVASTCGCWTIGWGELGSVADMRARRGGGQAGWDRHAPGGRCRERRAEPALIHRALRSLLTWLQRTAARHLPGTRAAAGGTRRNKIQRHKRLLGQRAI